MLDELLDVFVPRKVKLLDAPDSHELEALTRVDIPVASTQESADAVQESVSDPQDTLEYWQGVWNGYREKNLQRRSETAAAARHASPDDSDEEAELKQPPSTESTVAPKAHGKQPGSKPRLAGYNHHVPSADKHLPNAVSKARMHDIVASIRQGHRYTEDDRHAAKQRMFQRAPEMD